MRYFLSSIIVFLFFSKVVLANMQDPTPTTNDNSDILMDKKSIHKMIDAGEYEKARSKLKIFIENNSSDHEAYNLLGYVERQLQNYELAINFYKKALSIDSNFTGAHHYIAITYLEMDNLNSAKYHLDKLDLICLFGCEDFYDLKNKIAFYEANNE
jgi:tetratricopeptide (TPR) repeat protein